MNPVDKFYPALLKSFGVTVDDEGILYLGEQVVKVDKKTLVMPTTDRLNSGLLGDIIGFHPLCEGVINHESAVLRKLRMLATKRISDSLITLMTVMIDISIDKDAHRLLTGDESDFLKVVSELSAKAPVDFNKVVKQISVNGKKSVVTIFFKRGGTWQGKKYKRIAFVDFPIIESLHADGLEVFDVKMKKNDKAQIRALVDYILPKAIDKEENYSFGSDDKIAPYLMALLGAYRKIALRLNAIADSLKSPLDGIYDKIAISLDWVDDLQHLEVMSKHIPPLDGNVGDSGIPKTTSIIDIPIAERPEPVQSTPPAPVREQTRETPPATASTASTREVPVPTRGGLPPTPTRNGHTVTTTTRHVESTTTTTSGLTVEEIMRRRNGGGNNQHYRQQDSHYNDYPPYDHGARGYDPYNTGYPSQRDSGRRYYGEGPNNGLPYRPDY